MDLAFGERGANLPYRKNKTDARKWIYLTSQKEIRKNKNKSFVSLNGWIRLFRNTSNSEISALIYSEKREYVFMKQCH